MKTLLELIEVSVKFGGHTAVNRVSMQIPAKQFISIAGPNGAGKTTLFNLISGQLTTNSGKIIYKDRDITFLKPYQRARIGMGRSFQITNVFPHLSVLENVRLAVQAQQNIGYKLLDSLTLNKRLTDKAFSWIEQVHLAPKAADLAITLTHGEKRKLEIAILLALESELLLLDEPTAGMSLEEVPTIIKLLSEIKEKENKTILLIEHKMDMLLELSDHLFILNHGKLIGQGNPQAIMNDPIVQSAYLGGYDEQFT